MVVSLMVCDYALGWTSVLSCSRIGEVISGWFICEDISIRYVIRL